MTAPLVHARSLLVFALGFPTDVIAPVTGVDAYGDVYEMGVDMIQTNSPELLAAFLGRP